MADLENLRQLVKNLENYGAQVKEHVEAFESLQDRLGDAEDDAEDGLEAIGKEVAAVQDELDRSEDDALGAVKDLTSEARDIADDRLSEAKDDLESAGRAAEARAGEEGGEIDEARQELADDGFSAADAALDEAESEYEAEQQELRGAFQALAGGIAEAAARLDQAAEDLVAKIGEAHRAVTDAEKALEQETADSAEAFNAAGGELLQELKQTTDGSKEAYVAFEQGGLAAHDEVTSAFANGCEASVSWIGQVGEQLGTAAEEVTTVQAAHRSELESVQTEAVASVGAVVTTFERLSEDLRRCNQVVDQIAELLSKLDGQ